MWVVWALGLTLCGALRTVLLWEQSDIAILSAVGSLLSFSSAKVGVCARMRTRVVFQSSYCGAGEGSHFLRGGNTSTPSL